MCLWNDTSALRKARRRKTAIIAYKVYEKSEVDCLGYRAPFALTRVPYGTEVVIANPCKQREHLLYEAQYGRGVSMIEEGAIHCYVNFRDAVVHATSSTFHVILRVDIEPKHVVGVEVERKTTALGRRQTRYAIAASQIKLLEEVPIPHDYQI